MARRKSHFRPYKLHEEPKRRPDSRCRKAVEHAAPEPTHTAKGLMMLLKGGERLPQDAFRHCRRWLNEHGLDKVSPTCLVAGLTMREGLEYAIPKLYR